MLGTILEEITPWSGDGNVNVEDIDNTAVAANISAKSRNISVAGAKTRYTSLLWRLIILMKKPKRHYVLFVEKWHTPNQH
jgi:hypothetical protein